ncbi:MAG: hypothetical protein NVSMB44_00560 [Ktedonobacteraceae bacterium]
MPLCLALPLALCLLLSFPATTQAHAILLKSDPARDARLNSVPDQVRMWFSEDLNPTFSSAVIVNAENQRVDKKDARVSPADPREMTISLRPNLPASVYIVVWRTQSADDGHILRGSFRFSVAQADGTVPALSGGVIPGQNALGADTSSSGATTGQLDSTTFFSFLMTTLLDLGVVFWVGAQLWHSFVLQSRPESDPAEQREADTRAEQRFERYFALPTLCLLLLANLGVLLGQALLLTAGSMSQAFSLTLLTSLAANGRFGTYWTVRLTVLLVALVLAIFALVWRHRARIVDEALAWINLVLALALLIAVALSGHAAAVSGDLGIFAVLSDWLHLLAASLWIGGMLYLALIYLPVLGQARIERAQVLLTILARFSPLAIAGVVIMAITGPFNATVHMESFNQLLTTAYGRALLVKVVLIGALLVTSAFHVGFLRPRLAKMLQRYTAIGQHTHEETPVVVADPVARSGAQELKQLEGSLSYQQHRLTTILRWEPLLGVGVLICTGLLAVFAGTLQPVATSAPQQAQQRVVAQPFNATVKTKDNKFTIKLNVSPNHFGTNVFTASVLDSNGTPDTNVGVTIYTQMVDMDMGTDAVNLQPDGKGHFSAQGDLNMSGHWHLRLQVRTPQNTLHEGEVNLFTPF